MLVLTLKEHDNGICIEMPDGRFVKISTAFAQKGRTKLGFHADRDIIISRLGDDGRPIPHQERNPSE